MMTSKTLVKKKVIEVYLETILLSVQHYVFQLSNVLLKLYEDIS